MTTGTRRVVVIGAGHNGLAAAFYLARAGWKPLVLERRADVGGGAITAEIAPGFSCPLLSHRVLIWSDIARDMALTGLTAAAPSADAPVFAPGFDGPPVLLHTGGHGSDGLALRDRNAHASFRATMARLASVAGALFTSPPPDIDAVSARDAWNLLRAGRRFRALGRTDQYRLLRWGPMSLADLMHEWFESDLLRAALAGPGLSGTALGPRSAGGALVLLMHEAHRGLAGGDLRVAGGPGALTRAMAAAAGAAGAEIRTAAGVGRILIEQGRVAGVLTEAGEAIATSHVVSAVDPKTTFLRLMDPLDLDPGFAQRMRNYRAGGTLAKVNLALAAMPSFTGAPDMAALAGRIHVGPTLDYMERAFDHAKYGEASSEPWLDVSIPTILDPSLAPSGAHVMSIYAHYAPRTLRHGSWASERDPLLRRVLDVLERTAPGLGRLVVAAQIVTPEDLEREYGLWGGHVFHGELALDQLFAMRPLLGHGRYTTPFPGLTLCGAGTHPGGFLTAASGRHAARLLTGA